MYGIIYKGSWVVSGLDVYRKFSEEIGHDIYAFSINNLCSNSRKKKLRLDLYPSLLKVKFSKIENIVTEFIENSTND